ncbi:hypothetical protein OOZ15_06440 [Galbibacter sp. EGI 63066]|uniref:hypothetical protein n=1 Tax=Galbibacter sp. EGI 63066 TaxID=2993559 RepID=UPI002248CC02|nr:hypothetical protein [Galbibacter sp. EGI 63066]MCX2679578.1 hypothetical protein [Galbibacter sp. EGI 63066]
MALDNLISVSFTKEELVKLDNHLKGIKAVLKDKTVNLTPEERGQYGRIANQNKLIVNKAKKYMETHPDWVPRFVDKKEFDRDYEARTAVEDRVKALENLTQQLVDTKTLLDHDNYNNALTFYRMVRFLSEENEPGAGTVYQDMKVLFHKSSTEEEAVENG